MNQELRLLLGDLTDEQYRARLEGYPLWPVARPGWSQRFRRIAEGIGAFVVLVGLFTLILGGGAIAVALGVPPR